MDNLQRTMWFKGPDSLIFEYSQRYIKSANISERICSKNEFKLITQMKRIFNIEFLILKIIIKK
jgi:hypothetical protein